MNCLNAMKTKRDRERIGAACFEIPCGIARMREGERTRKREGWENVKKRKQEMGKEKEERKKSLKVVIEFTSVALLFYSNLNIIINKHLTRWMQSRSSITPHLALFLVSSSSLVQLFVAVRQFFNGFHLPVVKFFVSCFLFIVRSVSHSRKISFQCILSFTFLLSRLWCSSPLEEQHDERVANSIQQLVYRAVLAKGLK